MDTKSVSERKLKNDEQSNNTDKQLVVFQLGKEFYGVSITHIQEIVEVFNVTRVPGMTDFIKGMMNLRGRIIPIIDLRIRFGMRDKGMDEKTRIVVADVAHGRDSKLKQQIGFLVDTVTEVIRIPADAVEPVPEYLSQIIHQEYLSGIVTIDDQLIIILELANVAVDLEQSIKQAAVIGKEEKK